MTTPAPRPEDNTTAAREAKLRAVHDQLATAVADLASDQAWQQLLHTAARFHRYSPHNVLLISAQRPTASAVAGFHTWKQLGRQVRKGEKGIAILAPVLRRHPDPAGTTQPETPPAPAAAVSDRPGPPGQAPRRIVGFRVVHVFDLAQTDGPDLPTAPTPILLSGQAPEGLYDGLADQMRHEGFQLLRQPLAVPHLGEGRANGITDYFAKTVIVDTRLIDAQACKTLAHELGHVLLHRPDARPDDLTRPRAEVEAESVAYVVTAAHGLDSGDYTVPYVTGWAGGDLALVQQTAERVLTTAQTILQHTAPPATHALPDATERTRELAHTLDQPVEPHRRPAAAFAEHPALGRLTSPSRDTAARHLGLTPETGRLG